MIKCQCLPIGFVLSVCFDINNKTQKINFIFYIKDNILQTNFSQTDIESDSVDQLQNKLKRYTADIESLRNRGIGK